MPQPPGPPGIGERDSTSKKTERAKKKQDGGTNPTAKKMKRSSVNSRHGGVVGYCDICCMSGKYKRKGGMVLWKCQTCGVCVHGHCYSGLDDPRRSKPRPDFQCRPCQAVGKSFKVREIQPLTGDRLVVTQDTRPTECCLCSVDDGIPHAMHPIYDHHGPKGRQIYLPKSEGKPRRLAWAHTLCCQIASRSGSVCVYACLEDGSYDADEDEDSDLLSDDESDNSDLDCEEGDELGIGHWVYWGFLHQQLGKAKSHADPWTKQLHNQKMETSNCIYCGKNDKQMVKLNHHAVYQSLRVPLQCTANNRDKNQMEHQAFRKTHEVGDPCCQPLHPGCAMWGRNDEGEYSRARRAWFLPGLTGEEEDVMEVYCNLHALDLFKSHQPGCDMEKKLRGPFSKIAGTPRRKQSVMLRSAPAEANALPDFDSESESEENEAVFDDMRVIPRFPPSGQAVPVTKKQTSTHDKIAGHKLVVAVDNNERRIQERLKAGEAIQIRTKKHGRLVAQRNSNTATALTEASTTKSTPAHEDDSGLQFAQSVLDELWKVKAQCNTKGKALNSTVTAKVRVKQLNAYDGDLDTFRWSWGEAMSALDSGIHILENSLQKQIIASGIEGDNASYQQPEQRSNTGDFSYGGNPNTLPKSLHGSKQEAVANTNTQYELNQGDRSVPGQSHATVAKPNASTNYATRHHSDDGNSVNSWETIATHMARDIGDKLEPFSELGTVEEQLQQVTRIVKDSRKHWRKASGLTLKSDFNTVWKHCASMLEARYSWLEFNSNNDKETKSAGAMTTERTSDSFANKVDAVTNHSERDIGEATTTQGTEAAFHNSSKRGNQRAEQPRNRTEGNDTPTIQASPQLEQTLQEHLPDHELVPGQHGLPGMGQVHLHLPPPSRWSHLFYGPYYNKAGYRIKEWDSYEVREVELVEDGEIIEEDDADAKIPADRSTGEN
ncbi:expressed unknown protein [Seminavis robusta]|uniref:Uncharacterized protein n=1 Tax=Seminavis robusta TaxID=568900 RepID=A0A9N8HBR0_9STRA|nr:expressed unknown protein [Seminavis robusta]|eukprot:Sro288_g108780.1 n/a (943) ;mRNA; f:30704-33618